MSEGYFVLPTEEELELAHHGILGQRWGIRRYQNADGSLTPAGLKRYGSKENLNMIKKAKAESEAYAIKSKARLKAQKAEDKRLAKIRKQETKEEIKTAKELQKIRDKSQRERHQNQPSQGQYQQQYQGQGNQSQEKPNAGVKFLRAAKNLGVTNMVMDVGASTLRRYAFAKVDEALMSPTEKALKQYNTQLRTLVAKNNLTTAKIDERALRESYSNWNDGAFDYKTHQYRWKNARGGTNYSSDYQRYVSNNSNQKKDDRR